MILIRYFFSFLPKVTAMTKKEKLNALNSQQITATGKKQAW